MNEYEEFGPKFRERWLVEGESPWSFIDTKHKGPQVGGKCPGHIQV